MALNLKDLLGNFGFKAGEWHINAHSIEDYQPISSFDFVNLRDRTINQLAAIFANHYVFYHKNEIIRLKYVQLFNYAKYLLKFGQINFDCSMIDFYKDVDFSFIKLKTFDNFDNLDKYIYNTLNSDSKTIKLDTVIFDKRTQANAQERVKVYNDMLQNNNVSVIGANEELIRDTAQSQYLNQIFDVACSSVDIPKTLILNQYTDELLKTLNEKYFLTLANILLDYFYYVYNDFECAYSVLNSRPLNFSEYQTSEKTKAYVQQSQASLLKQSSNTSKNTSEE